MTDFHIKELTYAFISNAGVALVGYSTGGYRLSYGGGFYDRTLATLQPRPFTVGLGHAGLS